MTSRYDAIVIGGGHNGLVAAAYLARAGLGVTVLEQRTTLGGAASSHEALPGFLMDAGAHDAGGFLPKIAQELRLERHGLSFLQAPAHLHSLLPEGGGLTIWRDAGRAQEAIRQISVNDAERYPAFYTAIARMQGVLSAMADRSPPDLETGMSLQNLYPWLKVALQVRRLGRRDMVEFLRVIPMPVSDLMEEWFESKAMRGAIGSAGVAGSMQGPLASGTATMMLYAGIPGGGFRAGRFVRGGMGKLAEALAAELQSAGGAVRTGAKVSRVLLQGERAAGVQLANGERLPADVVLCSVDPRTTLLDLVEAANLEVRVARQVQNIRFRGSTARVNIALAGAPVFRGDPPLEALTGHITLCPSLEYLERAYDDAKRGRFSEAPYLDMTIPTILDPSRAPDGKHLLTVSMQYAPYRLGQSGWDQQREALADRVVEMLTEHMPGLPDLILDRQVITPKDLETDYGLPEGSIFHGQMGLDQLLFMRPIPGYGSYRSPVDGLYFCGAGAHPGGGVSGAPGRNAAREYLRDRRRR